MAAKRFAVAHRAPANRAAAEAFRSAGATVFEIDVQWSERGLAISHFRPFAWPLRWFERDRHRFRRARGLVQDPLLAETMALLPEDADVLFDLKDADPGRRRECCELLAGEISVRATANRWIVSNESATDVSRLRRAGFTGWLTIRDREQLNQALAGELDADGVCVRHSLVDAASVDSLHERVADVVAWTVNGVGRARQLLHRGVDGITTDSLSVVRSVVEAPAATVE